MTRSLVAPRLVECNEPTFRGGTWKVLDERQFGDAPVRGSEQGSAQDLVQDSPQEKVARDVELGKAVASGQSAPLFRLWENCRALVVSHKETRLPHYAQAVQQMAAAGWPVLVRESGGTAVPHGPGVLQLSMLMPRSAAVTFSTDDIYQQLCQPLQLALESLGIHTLFGQVPGAFCDGRYNLVARDKKIAGTAQVWRANVARRAGKKEGYVLAHASLFVSMDTRQATEAVNRFYDMAGDGRRFDAESLVSVSDCLGLPTSGLDTPPSQELIQTVRSRIIHAIPTHL